MRTFRRARLALIFSLSPALWAGERDVVEVQPVSDFGPARPAPLSPVNVVLPLAPPSLGGAAVQQGISAAQAAPSSEPQAQASGGRRLIDTLSAAQLELGRMGETESSQTAERDFNARAQLAGGQARAQDQAQAVVDAYQDGRLSELGVDVARQEALAAVAKSAVLRTLEDARFKTKILYGILGTRVYESEDLPGLVLKTYFTPFGKSSKSWRGYSLAKERLGGLFAQTTLVEGPITVVVDGKPRRLSWALAQEEINTKDVANYGARAGVILEKMELRGVRDRDIGPRPGFHPVEFTRNLGETADGRFVHFDADFFVSLSEVAEGPKRVRDPPALRRAIEQAQLDYLRGSSRN